ncbi:head-tail connector protein [Sphingomonas hylomeconis]|uniref:PhiE125 gp8 family phage protein n=1 Tax=Sphingomonas hylomeconis TaxID=1395958 RepID=A0ABV7T053_9SPHN|nr:hypothetical protein [Sphingomonas hylomeconis]
MAPGFPAQVIADARVAAKDYARVSLGSEDALFDDLAAAALAMAETFLRTSLIVRAHRVVLPAAGGWQLLPVGPVTAIVAVLGVPAEGAAFALPVDAYAIDVDAAGDGWVRVTAPGAAGRVAVTVEAGLALDWAGLPGPIAQGVVRLIGHLHAARDGDGGAPPAAVTALWRPYRRLLLAERGR